MLPCKLWTWPSFKAESGPEGQIEAPEPGQHQNVVNPKHCTSVYYFTAYLNQKVLEEKRSSYARKFWSSAKSWGMVPLTCGNVLMFFRMRGTSYSKDDFTLVFQNFPFLFESELRLAYFVLAHEFHSEWNSPRRSESLITWRKVPLHIKFFRDDILLCLLVHGQPFLQQQASGQIFKDNTISFPPFLHNSSKFIVPYWRIKSTTLWKKGYRFRPQPECH